MFILGICAIFQIIFIPGFILNHFIKFKGGFFYKVSAIFASSLILNFFLVYLLVLVKAYNHVVILSVFLLETFSIIILNWKKINAPLQDQITTFQTRVKTYVNKILEWIEAPLTNATLLLSRQLFQIFVFGLALSLVFWFLRRFTNGIGTVFNTWDAVLAYNNWAQNWAQNILTSHSLYPQLLPTNLSLTYVFINNTEVVLFAKAIMPIFCLLISLTFFEQGVNSKKTGYFIAIILFYLLIKKFTGEIFTDGYADIPVMFMVFLTLNQLIKQTDEGFNSTEFAIGLFFSVGAGLTKQVGLYIFAIYPILHLILNLKDRKVILTVLKFTGLGLVLLLSWYLPLIIKSINNLEYTSLPGLVENTVNTYGGLPWYRRGFDAFLSLDKYIVLYIFCLPLFFVIEKKLKLIDGLFIIPFSIIWSVFFSYDSRNLAITFPVIAILIGLGTEQIIDYLLGIFSKIKTQRLKVYGLYLLTILGIIIMAMVYTDEKIIKKQRDEQKLIFSPEINEALYSLPFGQNNCTKIMTNYPVSYLPGLENNQINTYFLDFSDYQKMVADEQVCWILVPNYVNDIVKQDIESKIQSGMYQLIWETDKWVPYQLIKVK